MRREVLLDEDWFDFYLTGIQSTKKTDYSFVYQFNQRFSCKFIRIQDLDVIQKNETYCYTCFEWLDENTASVYHIIKNLPNNSIQNATNQNLNELFSVQPKLIPELNHYDFLLKSEVPHQENPFVHLSLNAKNVDLQIIPLQLDGIKTKRNLIF